MKVWLLEHDDRMYEMGDKYVRGIYGSEDAATAALPAKEVKTGPIRSDPHDEHCCDVTEWDVEAAVVFEPSVC